MSVAPDNRAKFLALLDDAVRDGTLTKLTLGKPRGTDPTLHNLFVRPVALKGGPHLAFVWRHATRDVTKNFPANSALAQIGPLVGSDFLDAHLFTVTQTAQLECQPDGRARLKLGQVSDSTRSEPQSHDSAKNYLISANAPWLRALGVTNDRGQPREGMADKFRQIQKFTELLSHLIYEAFPGTGASVPTYIPGVAAAEPGDEVNALRPLTVVDAGSGKGYLTFALSALLGARARITGIEFRPQLVELCNRVADEHGLAPHLGFIAGTIADAPHEGCDILIALHACDTATDDALARGIAAGAKLLVVAPCCQKELRPQLTAPPVLADALRHGIFQERQAEFVTDALRAQLLEWAGYKTKVFEFISTEHTAKNLMIAAIKTNPAGAEDDANARRLRAFAGFYGIKRHALAHHLNFLL